MLLSEPIKEEWAEQVKAMHWQNRENTIKYLKAEYGELLADVKIQNFIDLGPKPISVIAFHNTFFSQVRNAFVVEAYYPALTGVCALGERILNHLVLSLRENFKTSPEYKKVYRKDSFDDWSLAIETLDAWDVLLPKAAKDFRVLMKKRHQAIHFRPEIDMNARELALEAIKCMQGIISEQFSGFGSQPWFITGVPGEIYIKREWESNPFIRLIYLKNGLLVGPRHKIESFQPQIQILDPDHLKPGSDISDDEFVSLRKTFNNSE